MKIRFVTIVPSPYQRDLFGAMTARADLELKVYYLEAASPDSPWPEKQLRSFEQILPGFWLPFAGARWHFNFGLPDFSDADLVVLSSYTSWTGQLLMRRTLRNKRWLFWGERLRDQASSWRKSFREKLARPIGSAVGIVGIGREAEKDYQQRFPASRHFCVPYHCELGPFLACKRLRRNGEPFTFLFCGQMIGRKGVDLLLGAFAELARQNPSVQLLLVGREAELAQFLSALDPAIRSRIRYAGFQPPEQLPDFFAQADAFVLPSRHDGWGVVVNQVLGAGLPIICSDAVGAAHDLVEPGVNGFIFPTGDAGELRRCLERVCQSHETAAEWGAASRRKAGEWTPEAGAEKWARVFNALNKSRK